MYKITFILRSLVFSYYPHYIFLIFNIQYTLNLYYVHECKNQIFKHIISKTTIFLFNLPVIDFNIRNLLRMSWFQLHNQMLLWGQPPHKGHFSFILQAIYFKSNSLSIFRFFSSIIRTINSS